MVRPPRVEMVRPGIGARLDRVELVAPVQVGHAAPTAEEIRVQRGRMLIGGVDVSTGRVGLPDLDQRVRNTAPKLVEHPPGDDDPFAHRFPVPDTVAGQIRIKRRQSLMSINRPRHLGQTGRQRNQRLGGASQNRGFVIRMDQRRMAAPVPLGIARS